MKTLKYLHKPLLILSIILFFFGAIMIYSASSVTAYMSYQVNPYNYFIKQIGILIFGFIIFLCTIYILRSTRNRFFDFIIYLLTIFIIVLLAMLLLYGKAKNEAISWINLRFISFQPSEFAKIISINYLACVYFNKFNKKKKKKYNVFIDFFTSFIIPFIPIFTIALLIFMQPDLGTCIIYCAICTFIYFVSPTNFKTKLFTVFIGIFMLICLYFGSILMGQSILGERQLSRINNYKNPCDTLLTTGNQVCNGYIAINNGGLTGVGLGKSTQKYLYLPEPYTDFIFAVVVEEWGVIVGVIIILSFLLLLFMILTVAKNAKTNKDSLICYGVCFYIFLHIIVNLMGIFGLIPLTGVPLPFLSYGGTFTICLIIGLSLVQLINIESRR